MRSIKESENEGYKHIHYINEENVDNLIIERQLLWNNKQNEKGPLTLLGIFMVVMKNWLNY